MDKPIVNLFRLERGDQGTHGLFVIGSFNCHSLELPWRDNQKNISCIPAGTYDTEIRISPTFGKVYWVKGVPNRSYILIHSGNWAGDVSKGYKTHVNGCLLLGQKFGTLLGQLAVLNSRIIVNRFMDYMQYEPFTLVIHESFM